MGISLNLEPYCNGCPHFEADVRKLWIRNECITQIKCEHALKCSAIRKYLQEELKKNGEIT